MTPSTPAAVATPLMAPSVTPTGHKAMAMATPTPGEFTSVFFFFWFPPSFEELMSLFV